MGYLKETVRGVSWVGAFRVSTRGVAFARTIVLARILTPAQFGVFGIASLVISLLEILTETGINIFLIQKKEDIKEYLGTAWVVSIVRGALITLVLVVIAPTIAAFFNSPGSQNAIYLISLVALIRGFINPSIVVFMKELRFKEEFWFKFVVFLFDSLVAIAVSLATGSAIGMVWGLIAGAILEVILSFVFVHPWPRFEFIPEKTREVVSRGKWLTGAGIFQFLFRQGDDAVVGKVLGEGSVGIYQVAYKISSLPISEITDVVARVVFPVYVKIAREPARLRAAFLKTTFTVAALAVFLGALLFVFGELIILVFLGNAWLAAIPLIKILAIFGVVQALTNSTNSLFLALEKQKYVLVINAVNIAGLAVSILPLTLNFGLTGAATAPLLGALAGLPVMAYLVFRSLSEIK